jgi:hypothetical protein
MYSGVDWLGHWVLRNCNNGLCGCICQLAWELVLFFFF